jgi:SAM-dependent methyltransferase
VDRVAIRSKFGDDYIATEVTFRLGIDIRLARAMAERFAGRRVLETCTGAGFTTIALAETAAHVVTIEVNPVHQAQARANVQRAQLLHKVTFILGDAMSDQVPHLSASVDSAFLDPDWAVTGPDHVYRFRHSNMRPPVDALLEKVFRRTSDVALVLPPDIDVQEIECLLEHERQSLYLEGHHALYCLYFGSLMRRAGKSEFHV